jgi:uncharacterized membrane-anchored protein YhcB (DUF1043 family)|tara:strand:+ start:127 stop:303 length:177 start_codon:yes stop_codon:yes gene_type:complete
MVKKTRNIKKSKHDQIVNDYDKIKSRHLEKLANKMLKDEEKRDNLRSKNIKGNFLDKF